METIANTALGVGVIAALILLVGGVRLVKSDRKRGLLMMAAAAVILGNVLIWTI